jgi:hypothetical protein
MMFSNRQKEAYRSICVPDGLYARIVEKEQPKRLKLLPLVSGLAACMALVVVLGLLWQPGGSSIILNGQKLEDEIVFYDISPASDVRSSPLFSVPVELKLTRSSKITVSHGSMTVEGGEPVTELNANHSVTIWWQIERSEEMPVCEMEIQDNKSTTLITLNYNNAEITAKKKEK